MKNPIQDASLDIMDKWAKANNVKLTRIPMAYSVFMEKVHGHADLPAPTSST